MSGTRKNSNGIINGIIIVIIIILLAIFGYYMYQNTQHLANLEQQMSNNHNNGICTEACPEHCPQHEVSNGCAHACTEENCLSAEWVKVGAKDVCCRYMVTNQMVCVTCGNVVTTSTVCEDSDTTHNFGSDKVCNDCGYTKQSSGGTQNTPTQGPSGNQPQTPAACKHNGEKRTEYGDWAKGSYHNNSTCCYEKTRKVSEYCKKCNALVSESTESQVVTHEKKTSSSENWVNVGRENCCRKLVKVTKTVCTECNYNFGTNEETIQEVSNHEWYGAKCKHCGFKRPAAGEGFGESTGTIQPNENGWNHNDTSGEANPVG